MNKDLYDAGMAIRRDVLGDEYVERALSNVDDFNEEMQNLVTEYCWGAIWTRPGLDRKTRSILNLGILVALNRPHELKAHVRGALRNGLSEQEIAECLLQTAVYCGVPAGVDSFRNVKEVIDAWKAEKEAE